MRKNSSGDSVNKEAFVRLSLADDSSLYWGDCREVLRTIEDESVEMVFADPPYFLSNGGFSVQSGRQVSVNKGIWDQSQGGAADEAFSRQWLTLCRQKLKPEGTIWVCGTVHNIATITRLLEEIGCKILNLITWQKPNPPPNLSCRTFKHSAEFLLWARKSKRIPHCFNYELMRRLAGNRQMTDVWRMSAAAAWEKTEGKHPTQKPLALVVRTILASTNAGALILDPFVGSGTTGLAAHLTSRRFIGIEQAHTYVQLAQKRWQRLLEKREVWASKIPELAHLKG